MRCCRFSLLNSEFFLIYARHICLLATTLFFNYTEIRHYVLEIFCPGQWNIWEALLTSKRGGQGFQTPRKKAPKGLPKGPWAISFDKFSVLDTFNKGIDIN